MNSGIVVHLKNRLPETSWPWVIRALRQEELCWNALSDSPDLLDKALQYCGEVGENWTPANLFYLALGKPALLNSIPDGEKFEQQGHATFKLLASSARESWKIKLSLNEAGYVAYYIFQQWNKHKDWDHILGEMEQLPKECWKPVFACLYGMLPNPNKYLHALLQPEHGETLHELSIHTYLSNPFPVKVRVDTLLPLLVESQIKHKAYLAQQIQKINAELATTLARALIDSENLEDITTNSDLDIVEQMLMRASLFQIAGDHASAMPMLDAAWQISRKMQADMAANLAQQAARNNDTATARAALEKADALASDLPDTQKTLVATRIHTGQLDPAVLNGHQNGSGFHTENPAALLATAQLAFHGGDTEQAREAAMNALMQLVNDSAYQPSEYTPEDLTALADLLLELGQPTEAVLAAELALDIDPTQTNALYVYSRGQLQRHAIEEALDSAHMALALNPDREILRIHLKNLLTSTEAWAPAIQELEILTTRNETPALEHLLELAYCAIQAQEPHKATLACQTIMQAEPENGLAHFYMGQAVALLGDKDTAATYYADAVRFAPEQAEIWLALAQAMDQEQSTEKARELLENGLDVVDQPLMLHIALGRVAEKQGDDAAAYRHLETAFEMLDSKETTAIQIDVTAAYCSLLYERELFTKALEILAPATQQFPNGLPLIHLLGKTQFALGAAEEAQTILLTARGLDPTHAGVLMDLAQALLATPNNAAQAIEVIETAQQLELDNPLPCALLGQAYLQQHENALALKMFQLVGKSDLANDPQWKSVLLRGIASSSRGIGQPEVAIAALSEALETDADDLASRKILCEAYIEADLQENALIHLEVISTDCEGDVATSLWVIEISIKLDRITLAQDCLYTLNPETEPPAVLLQCGRLWLQLGNESAGATHLEKLLAHEASDAGLLQDAALAWLGAGRVEKSIPYLEKALSLNEGDEDSLMQDLTHAYYHSGKFSAALDIVEHQLTENPNAVETLFTKAKLHTHLKQVGEALTTYYDLLDLGAAPEGGQAQIYYQIGKLEWQQGNFSAALDHAERAYELAPHVQVHQYLAAELNYACLNFDRTKLIIGESYETSASKLNWIFLQAEIALMHNQEIIATDLIMPILELAADHPRLLAIQSMLSLRLGQRELALTQFEEALAVIENIRMGDLQANVESNIDLTLVQTALGLQAWEPALQLAEHVLGRMPTYPRAHLAIAKALTLRAEHTHLCDDLQVIQNRATVMAASTAVHETVKEHLYACEDNTSLTNEHPILSHWVMRAEMAFTNAWVETFELNHHSAAASWAAGARRTGNFGDVQEKLSPFADAATIACQMALGLMEQHPEQSLSYARKALKQEPRNPLWLATLGLAAEALEQWSMMEQSFTQALKYWNHEPRWHHYLAIAAMKQYKIKDAIQQLELACQAEPGYLPHMMLLGSAYLQDHAPGHAVRVLETASQQAPQHPEIWQLLAEGYAAIQEFDKADKAALRLSKLMPTKTEPIELRAKVALQAQQPEKALQLTEKAMKNHTHNHQLYSIKAKALAAMKQTPEAIQALDQAVSQADEPLPYLLERAQLVGRQQGVDAELKTLVALAHKYPDQPEVLAALSASLKENGQLDEATRAAHHALRKNAGELDITEQAQIHYRLGLLQQELGQLDQAIHHLDKAIEFLPGYAEPYLVMGQTYHERRDFKPALDYYKQAIDLAPNDTRPYCEAARSLKECKNYTTAEAMLRRAVELAPLDIGIRRQLTAVMTMNLVHNASA